MTASEISKRSFDCALASTLLVLLSPLLGLIAIVVWLQDLHSPFYIAPRVARNGATFRMVKFRSMAVGADQTGVDSTATNDQRITSIGAVLRAYKLDELPQLWNVVLGDMSFVGPRPQVHRDVEIYTDAEREMLSARPGITDLSSIVFADEGQILEKAADPDLAYNQMIRPWKSRLALIYVRKQSFLLDLKLICLTVIALISRERALEGVQEILRGLGADAETLRAAKRGEPLVPYPPPGATAIVTSRSKVLQAAN